jgi:hypothetical protein
MGSIKNRHTRRLLGRKRKTFLWPKEKFSRLLENGRAPGVRFKPTRKKLDPKKRAEYLAKLRPRDSLKKRGQATALGLHLVRQKLRTLNAGLADQLLANSPPFGFGSIPNPQDRASELLGCLYELREMIVTLKFHLDIDDVTELPSYVPFQQTSGLTDLDETTHDYHDLLAKDGQKAGEIALVGLVNRFSSAVFSDHHGLLLHAQMHGKPDLHIYYHSLDATYNFVGGTAIRSMGGMLPYTGPNRHDTSQRGAVGFSQQLGKLMIAQPKINVIILAETGAEGAQKLIQGNVPSHWKILGTKAKRKENDITLIYDPTLAFWYSFSVQDLAIGHAAVVSSKPGTDSECTLLGCHILNKMANNTQVGKFLTDNKIAALFGDTNISTKGSSLGFKFKTIESNTSLTDSLTFDFSNSASDSMFDKLLVRTQ